MAVRIFSEAIAKAETNAHLRSQIACVGSEVSCYRTV